MSKIYKDPTKATMSFEEWQKQQEEIEKRRTHGAERIGKKNFSLYDAETAINKVCFDGAFRIIPMYFIPPDLENRESNGLYGYGCIMLNKRYYEAHGVDTDVINTIFHEMIHAYCDRHGIHDTAGEIHLLAFAEVCKKHGGEVMTRTVYGYSDVKLSAETLAKVKQEMRNKKRAAG